MGIVFGKTGVAEPAFSTLATFPSYTVRQYSVRYAIECSINSDNKGFRELAGYIGAIGTPQNEGNAPIAMTAPVVTTPQPPKAIAMTAPVVTTGTSASRVMRFILPAEFDALEKIPKPTNDSVRIVEVPEEVGAVTTFSGWVSPSQAEERRDSLIQDLASSSCEVGPNPEWQLWQYNPPFTIPFLRRNEVWIKLTQDQAKALASVSDSTKV
jgi:hypothetical protein